MRWRYLLLSCRLGNKFNCCILFAFWSIIIFWEIWMFDSSTFFLLWNRVTGPFFCLLLSMFWEKVKYNCEYLCQRVILYTNIYIYILTQESQFLAPITWLFIIEQPNNFFQKLYLGSVPNTKWLPCDIAGQGFQPTIRTIATFMFNQKLYSKQVCVCVHI